MHLRNTPLLSLFLLFCFSKTKNLTLYFHPTCPSNIKHEDCHTLSEWIKSGHNPFTNDTTVTFLAGNHFINSTKDSLDIKNVHSLIITGDQEEATLNCGNGLILNFNISTGINISQIILNSCTLIFSYLQDVMIDNAMVIDSDLRINQYYSDCACRYTDKIKPARKHMRISKSILHNSSLNNWVESSVYTDINNDSYFSNCFQLDISNIIIRNINRLNLTTAIKIWYANVVNISHITFWNNSSPLIDLKSIELVKLIGYNKISFNTGQGIAIASVNYIRQSIDIMFVSVVLMKHCRIEIFNNFDSTLAIQLGRKLEIRNSTIALKNNTSERGIMMLDSMKHICLIHSKLTFENNTCLQVPLKFNIWGAVMLLQETSLYLFSSTLLFSYNSAPLSGGITLIKSDIIFTNSSAMFVHNKGGNGGAIALYQGSNVNAKTKLEGCDAQHRRPNCSITDNDNCYPIHCRETIHLHFYSNRAQKGGAIFIEDSDYVNHGSYEWPIGTVEFSSEESMDHPNAFLSYEIYLMNNSAELAGNELYGGWIDLLFYVTHFVISPDDMNAVASDPTRICLCIDSNPDCNITQHQVTVFPGQKIEIEAVAVGQRMGIVPSIAIAKFSDDEGSLGEGQGVQNVYKQCTSLVFTIYSADKFKVLNLTLENIRVSVHDYLRHELPLKYHVLFQQLLLNITLKNCPLGFVFNLNRQCMCAPLINSHSGIECVNFTIVKTEQQKWLFATPEYNNDPQHYGIIIHDYCPYDYCLVHGSQSFSFHLEFPDDQCAFRRSGILCGACKVNFSQVLGTSKCKKCSNFVLPLLILGTLLSGIMLIGFLILFNVTVSIGTINGLIFYANIIRANQSVFFPPEFSSFLTFLNTFIAWFNLDLGIETCFYDGLDAYAKTWLQFVFPVYIWLLVTAIIVASHYSTIVSRLTPNNAVQVLATLFLLSYAKILRVVITVFSFTVLVYPDGFRKRVWLYDGNIEFLRGKHIPLFIFTLLLLLLLSIPYTLSLISTQWLQRISHYRIMSWVHKLMPLFDAYTGPYKNKHRYWTGLLLLIRVVVIAVFSLNVTDNPSVYLLSTAMISFALLAYLSRIGGVYIRQFMNILEITSILNLGILSVVSLYQLFNNRSAGLGTTASTGFAFALFLVIIAFHITQRPDISKRYKM